MVLEDERVLEGRLVFPRIISSPPIQSLILIESSPFERRSVLSRTSPVSGDESRIWNHYIKVSSLSTTSWSQQIFRWHNFPSSIRTLSIAFRSKVKPSQVKTGSSMTSLEIGHAKSCYEAVSNSRCEKYLRRRRSQDVLKKIYHCGPELTGTVKSSCEGALTGTSDFLGIFGKFIEYSNPNRTASNVESQHIVIWIYTILYFV